VLAVVPQVRELSVSGFGMGEDCLVAFGEAAVADAYVCATSSAGRCRWSLRIGAVGAPLTYGHPPGPR
jgi:hypothetical protein